MNASDSTIRRFTYHPGYALVEELLEFVVAGWRKLSRLAARYAAAQRSRQARRELQRLSDHTLKDIGLSRSDIDGLFR